MTNPDSGWNEFPIRRNIDRPTTKEIVEVREFPTATLHEAGGRIGVLPSAIKPVVAGMRIAGPAVTVNSPGGDNLWLHRAIYIATPGDVLVVSVSQAYEYGYWGEIMSAAAKARGLGGLVIDGCVRDLNALAEATFPVFARGICIRGTGKDENAHGWINWPIRLSDEIVKPGDLIVGDDDGLVNVPRQRVADVIAKSRNRENDEAAVIERLNGGESTLDIYGLHRGTLC